MTDRFTYTDEDLQGIIFRDKDGKVITPKPPKK